MIDLMVNVDFSFGQSAHIELVTKYEAQQEGFMKDIRSQSTQADASADPPIPYLACVHCKQQFR